MFIYLSMVEASFDQEALLREGITKSATSGYRDQVFGKSNTKFPAQVDILCKCKHFKLKTTHI